MQKVIIVIPVYKEELSKPEQISLRQVQRILGHYPIVFIAPERMRAFLTEKKYPAEYFPDCCFANRREYSRMLMDYKFYERFSDYEYMLIYQLDAFVFSDRLQEFCELNYDYIGAPVWRVIWPRILSRVGNGGFSLRKIASCIRLTKRKEEIFSRIDDDEILELFERAEDRFFGYYGARKIENFSLPSTNIARQFSIEFDVGNCYRNVTDNSLPFGCHAWSKVCLFPFWQKFIMTRADNEKLTLADIQSRDRRDYKTYYRDQAGIYYLLHRIIREGNMPKINSVLDKYLPSEHGYILWGNGIYGKDATHFLLAAQRKINCIFDAKAKIGELSCGLKVTKPNINLLTAKECKIIITTPDYENDIREILEDKGLVFGKDFFSYITIKRKFISEY